MKLLSGVKTTGSQKKHQQLINSLIHYEAKLGGELFGEVPSSHERQFFCLDEHTWVWHEQWTDASGRLQSVTTRYINRPTGIVKTTGDGNYQRLSEAEARHLYHAVNAYEKKVHDAYQKLLAA